jgi:DNA-binding CsgD family transcriptional regulator
MFKISDLTKREMQCFIFLLKGRAIKEIARELNIAPKTAEHHYYSIRLKLNCFRRSELVDIGIALGLVKFNNNTNIKR